MITGVVTQVYRNGDFDVWFDEQQFGSTCFRGECEISGKVATGDRLECRLASGRQGTIVAARRIEHRPHGRGLMA